MKLIASTAVLAVLVATPAFAQSTRTQTFEGENFEGTRTVTVDREAGTLSKDAEVTRLSDGATATKSMDRQRTEDGVTASGSRTGFDGRTASYEYERTRDGNGGFTAEGTATTRNGETFTGTGSRERTDNGFVSNRNIVNGAGETVFNRDATVSRVDGQITRSVETTRAQGFRPPRAGNRPPRARGPRGPRGPRG